MRLGKPLEHLQAALKATKENSDPTLTALAIGRQLAYAVYLFNDMLIWVIHTLTLTSTLVLHNPTGCQVYQCFGCFL